MELADGIIKSLESYPNDWTHNEYRTTHKSGLEIYVYGSWVWIEIKRPSRVSLTFVDKWRVSKAIQKSRKEVLSKNLDLR